MEKFIKENLSKSLSGKIHASQAGDLHYNAKKIINLSTGEIFGSIKSASKKYNVSNNSIYYCLSGKNKTCCGCKWDYLDNVDLNKFIPIENNNPNFKPKYQKRTIYIKELDKMCESLNEVSKILGVSISLISMRCNKLKKTNMY